MINSCHFIGNVGQAPEIKTIGESKVANFSIACNKAWTDQAGVKQTKTEWIRLVAWRKLAEIVEKYVKAGQQVYVEGEMETRQFDKDGAKHYATTINIRSLKMLGKKEETSDQGKDYGAYTPPPPPPANNSYEETRDDGNNDLPF